MNSIQIDSTAVVSRLNRASKTIHISALKSDKSTNYFSLDRKDLNSDFATSLVKIEFEIEEVIYLRGHDSLIS